MPQLPPTEIADVFRREYGRAVAVLVRRFGDIDLAEEAVQDAFTKALDRWPHTEPRRLDHHDRLELDHRPVPARVGSR